MNVLDKLDLLDEYDFQLVVDLIEKLSRRYVGTTDIAPPKKKKKKATVSTKRVKKKPLRREILVEEEDDVEVELQEEEEYREEVEQRVVVDPHAHKRPRNRFLNMPEFKKAKDTTVVKKLYNAPGPRREAADLVSIECKSCHKDYEIPSSLVPPKDSRFTCDKCLRR